MTSRRPIPRLDDYRIVRRSKKVFTYLLDRVGALLFLPIRAAAPGYFRARPLPPRHAKVRILLVRFAYLGDVVLSTAVPEQLKRWRPNARIVLLTSRQGQQVYAGNPFVDEIIAYDPPWFFPGGVVRGALEWLGLVRRLWRERFDVAIDLRADLRNILFVLFPSGAPYRVSHAEGGGGFLLTHAVPYKGMQSGKELHLDMIRGMGIRTESPCLDLFITDEETRWIRSWLGREGVDAERPMVCIHPGSRMPLKRWPAGRFAEVGDRLVNEFGVQVLLTGSPAEDAVCREVESAMACRPVNLCGRLSLRRFAALLREATLVVTNDTFAAHAAGACGTGVVCVVGPSDSRLMDATSPLYRVVEVKDLPCRPDCYESHCRHAEPRHCMLSIPVDAVYDAAADVLGRVLAEG